MDSTTRDLLSRIEALERELGRQRTAGAPAAKEGVETEPTASRRDLLRYGAAALGVAAAAGIAASPVEGADGGPVVIGQENLGASSTFLTSTTTGFGFYVTATNASYGVLGVASFIGVYGYCTSTSGNGGGVQGVSSAASGTAPGVYGLAISSLAPAVYGRHNSGNAVRAEIPSSSNANTISMYALNYSNYAGAGPGAGGFAIYGLSAKGHGLVGATAAAGAAAVVGATNGVAGAYAAALYGPVIVGGDFTVVGGAKSAAVPHPDGSHRRLYCVESPESWFEDFGRGTLACGEARIRLDPDFATVVDPSEYHVFLTGHDGRCDLSVSDQTPDGFRVASSGHAEGTFSWRVVAKRKDIAGVRFEPVEIPKEPVLPEVPASVHEPLPPLPDLSRMGERPRRPGGRP